MRYPAGLLGFLAIVFAGGSFSGVAADSFESKTVGESATLTIDVVPLNAHVSLDKVLIGQAHCLVSQAVAVTPGNHVVEIGAPGFLPATVNVEANVDWATSIWLQLVPEPTARYPREVVEESRSARSASSVVPEGRVEYVCKVMQ